MLIASPRAMSTWSRFGSLAQNRRPHSPRHTLSLLIHPIRSHQTRTCRTHRTHRTHQTHQTHHTHQTSRAHRTQRNGNPSPPPEQTFLEPRACPRTGPRCSLRLRWVQPWATTFTPPAAMQALQRRMLSVRPARHQHRSLGSSGGSCRHVLAHRVLDDASRMTSSVRDELPGRGKESKKPAEETMARVGSTVDRELREGECVLPPTVCQPANIVRCRQAANLGGRREARRVQG